MQRRRRLVSCACIPASTPHARARIHCSPPRHTAGRLCFALVYATTAALTFAVPVLPLWWLADHFLELVTGAAVLSTSLALVLYAASHRRGAVLAASASGVPAYDFWMGRELHPRLGRVDLKEFCELYPGMAAWAVLNLSFAHLELVTTGRVRNPVPTPAPVRLPRVFALHGPRSRR